MFIELVYLGIILGLIVLFETAALIYMTIKFVRYRFATYKVKKEYDKYLRR